jgi:hypothetical protein
MLASYYTIWITYVNTMSQSFRSATKISLRAYPWNNQRVNLKTLWGPNKAHIYKIPSFKPLDFWLARFKKILNAQASSHCINSRFTARNNFMAWKKSTLMHSQTFRFFAQGSRAICIYGYALRNFIMLWRMAVAPYGAQWLFLHLLTHPQQSDKRSQPLYMRRVIAGWYALFLIKPESPRLILGML